MSENTDMVYMEKGEDGVAVVYLNQPKKKNAINATMMDLLTDCFHAADEDPEVRVIVLRGSGNCFTSGGDLSQSSPEENTPEHARKTYRKYCRTVTAMRTIAKPIVAMVDGYAVGGGFALMLASDLVCVSETATVIPAFCQIGIAPEMGVVKFLPELVGMQRAKRDPVPWRSYFWRATGRAWHCEPRGSVGIPRGNNDGACASIGGNARCIYPGGEGDAELFERYQSSGFARA